MLRIYSIFILVTIFTAYRVFASPVSNNDADAASEIDQNEIAQTMKNMTELMSQVHEAPIAHGEQAYEKSALQKSSDVLDSLDDESEGDAN
jgi:spore coat polysaccharide biosynthesis predicted glycosyltransferase SpsG